MDIVILHELFVALLENRPAVFSLTTEQWKELFQFSKDQTICGILWDLIEQLPEEKRPPKDILLQWMMLANRIKNGNLLLNARVNQLFTIYKELGLNPILLKGQGIATYYPDPSLRMSGDIDLLFETKEEYEIANRWARENGSNFEALYAKHLSFTWKDVIVENHIQLTNFKNPRLNALLKEILNTELEACKNRPEYVMIDRQPIRFLSPTLNCFFMLLHKSNHLLEEGIGLRQLFDWAYFLHANHTRIDKDKFNVWIQTLKMEKMAYAFGGILTERMGLTESELPLKLPHSNPYKQIVWKEILSGGNFGHNYFKDIYSSASFGNLLKKLHIKLPRYASLYRLYPQEVAYLYRDVIRRGLVRTKHIVQRK